MSLPEDITGAKFGRLTTISYVGNSKWLCKCDCGELKEVSKNHLKSSFVRSCGCLRKEGPHTTHGKSKSRLYGIWHNVKSRCFNEKSISYKNYGARGIRVCNEWMNDFSAFYNWAISSGYSKESSIDRIDVNGSYEPSNCKWSTRKEQSLNKRTNVYVYYAGEKLTISQVAEKLRVSPYTLYSRLNKLNWNIEDAISIIPSYSNNKRSGAKCFN